VMSDLDRLIRFSVIAEELSFSEAARRLHVDQPWLSRQIQQLETQMGFALFVRSTRRVVLTPEGEELFAQAKDLASAAERCRQVSRSLMRSHSLMLAVGVNPYAFWLPERRNILESFQRRDERVKIEVVSNYTSKLISKLRKRLIDVALIAEPFDYEDLETMVVRSSPISLLVPPEDPLARSTKVPMSALRGREIPMISESLNPAYWESVYRPFVEAGAVPFTVHEGVAAVPFYAKDRRLPVLSVCWPHSEQGALPEFVHVELEAPAPLARFALVRRREPPRGLLTHFWSTAQSVIEGNVRPSAMITRVRPRQAIAA
jgi:DNA-binding transcriptional LysR family regulator